MRRKVLSLLLCMSLTLSGLLACSGGKEETTNVDTSSAGADQTQEAADETAANESDEPAVGEATEGLSSIFPLEEPITLTYYIVQNSAMSATMESYADVEFFKELEELTNVHIEWNHNVGNENFALMMTGGELPDMINWPLGNAAGGVAALLEDEIILNLTDLLPEHAPNYYNWMKNNPEEDKAFKLDDGSYYQFVNFNADWENNDIIYFGIFGPQIRQDWLDRVGMDMPATTDELYEVLCAFRDQDANGNGDPGDEVPFVIDGDLVALWGVPGSFGTRRDVHLQDGEIVYGPITDNYKTFLTYMNKLFSEGLINTDFAVNRDALGLLVQDRAGFTYASMGTVIQNHEALKAENPEANYVSVPWLVGPDGYQCFTRDKNANPRATAITTSCENPEIALAWLDYAYSYKGSIDSTFGVEGKSYEYVDGYPTIMDEVKENDNGWSVEQSMARWMLGPITYPNARDHRYYEQMNLVEDYMVDLQTNWALANDDITLPPIVMTVDEGSTYSAIMADIGTFVDEYSLKFITGDLSIEDEWDNYVRAIEGMNVSEALDCKKSAYERYQSR